MSNSYEDFAQEVANTPSGGGARADYFKLKEGRNEVLILSMPRMFSEMFGVGVAFENCGYGHLASVKSMCYVKDMADGVIKLAKLNYKVTSQIVDLGKGSRTKFEGFPMPYTVNIETKNAGKTNVSSNVVANEDHALNDEEQEILAGFDPVEQILDRMKNAQRKKLADDADYREEVENKIAVEEEKRGLKSPNGGKVPTVQIDPDHKPVATQPASTIEGLEYPESPLDPEDIPF